MLHYHVNVYADVCVSSRADQLTKRLVMCTWVKASATQEESQNFTRPLCKWFTQHHSQMLVNPPLTEACTVNYLLTHLDLDSDSHAVCF